MLKSVLQIGSVNWQTEEESTSGSGILHEGHHQAYKDLGLKVYSLFPSRVQESKKPDEVEILRLGHQIPIFTNIPTSSYRFSDMTDEQYNEYEEKLYSTVSNFVTRIEKNQNAPLDLIVAHHAFINIKVAADLNKKREEAGLTKIPIVVFVHGTALKMFQKEISESNLKFLPAIQKIMNEVAGVFTISREQKALFHEIFSDYPEEHVVVSPNGFDQRTFNIQKNLDKKKALSGFKTTETSGSRQVPNDADHIVTFVGKFADWKRLDALLKAATTYQKAFEEEGIKVITLIAGTGTTEQVAKYEGMACELGLTETYFLGPKMHPDLAKIYNISDIGVFPSKDEPFGLVLLECMACGTPVIGANSGGPRDFITPEVGYLVPENEGELFVNNLSEVIVKALKEDWKSVLGPKAHDLAHSKFTLKVQVEGIIKQAEEFVKGS